MKFECPTCERTIEVLEGEPRPEAFPFCCDRCRMADLGRWLSGDYYIPGEKVSLPDEEDPDAGY